MDSTFLKQKLTVLVMISSDCFMLKQSCVCW